MELTSQQKYSQSLCPQQVLLSRLKRALQLVSTHVNLVKIEGNTNHFLVLLNEKKKAQYKLWTQWQITIEQFVQIRVTLSNEHQQFLPPTPSIVIPDFISRLNRQSILGTYFVISQNPTLICFRHSFSADYNKKFFSSTIAEIFLTVSEQFAKWVTKLRMVGGEDKLKSDKMYTCLKKMRYLKQYFECERLNRPKATKNYNLKNSLIKIVEEAIRTIGYQPNLLNSYRINEGEVATNIFHIYKSQYDNLAKQISQKQKESVHNPIMRGIEIIKTINQKKFDEGGFSQIFRGQYIVRVTPTINDYRCLRQKVETISSSSDNEEKMVEADQSQLDKFSRKLLVKKVMKKCTTQADSFKNEINLLIFLRNDRQKRIAAYYIETHNQHENLFIQLYEKNLLVACQNWTEKLLLNASKQLIEGIAYLSKKSILHRDIKELNILIDRQNNIKIIDFGSACAAYQEKPTAGSYMAINNTLLSTPHYYFPYGAISNEYPGIKKKFTKQQYEQAATFDIFSVGTVLRNLFSLWRGFDNIFYRQLNYLADKCQQKNPEDRITPKEAQCYIYLLTQLYRLENDQNKKMSSKSSLAPEEKPCSQVFKSE